MSLTSKIKTIIETLYPNATYILSSRFKAGLASFDLQTAQLPLIILDNELSKDAEIKKNNNIQKNSKLIISVLNKDDAYNSDDESNDIIESCELIADRISVNIFQLPEIVPVSGNQKYRITPVFHSFVTDLSGVIVEMQVNENTTRPFCRSGIKADSTLRSADTIKMTSDVYN